MKYEKISINEKWAKTVSEDEFVKHESHHGLSEKQLKEAYRLVNPKKKPNATAKGNDSSFSVNEDIS